MSLLLDSVQQPIIYSSWILSIYFLNLLKKKKIQDYIATFKMQVKLPDFPRFEK